MLGALGVFGITNKRALLSGPNRTRAETPGSHRPTSTPHRMQAPTHAHTLQETGRPTHSTHTHVTYKYMQGARNAAGGHVHPLTPAPNQAQIIPPSPIPHTRAAASAAPAVSESPSLTGKTQTLFDVPLVGTHTSTPEAEFSSANVSVRLV